MSVVQRQAVHVPIGYTPPRRFGIRLGGCEKPLEDLIKQHSATLPPDHVYTLIEVGSAGCVTLRAFSDILREARGESWRAVGFDLTLDKAWSVNMDEVRASFGGTLDRVGTLGGEVGVALMRGMQLWLCADPRAYLRDRFSDRIDFAFIDGCHGKCAGLDFLAIESKVTPGGLVVFHDYGELEQGSDYQSHCREFISVRSYVHRLGLNPPGPGVRKGWCWVGEIKGSRHWGGDGNSCAVVQRTNEPLEHQPELSVD